MLKQKLKKLKSDEAGQSLVELAIILPLLVILLMLPVDFFRYINTKMILSSAASECIQQLDYASSSPGTAHIKIMDYLSDCYVDRLDLGLVTMSYNPGIASKTTDYTYRIYSSALADPNPAHYWDQFEQLDSNFETEKVSLRFSYDIQPITFWGVMFLGDTVTVETPEYTRHIYKNGYTPGP